MRTCNVMMILLMASIFVGDDSLRIGPGSHKTQCRKPVCPSYVTRICARDLYGHLLTFPSPCIFKYIKCYQALTFMYMGKCKRN
ncbi:hypothetical protein Trydic_g14207 [Trypoxylus dichotomus]